MNIKMTKVSNKSNSRCEKSSQRSEKKLENLNKVLDKQEQYSRRDCLLLHKLDESNNNKFR